MTGAGRLARLRRGLRATAAALVLLALIWLAWVWQAPGSTPDTIDSRRVHVVDGDSLTLTFDAGTLAPDGARTIRLLGIDAPEYRQTCNDAAGHDWPCGIQARERLAALVEKQAVRCAIVARDQYHRDLARCSTAETADIGRTMVAEGWALSNGSVASASGYPVEEARAAADKRGIWRGGFDNPRDWRDANRLMDAD